MLDIVRLRVLAAIAAHSSVTKAAKQLNYSQPAVSHHLARLEAETGARLVQRAGSAVGITPSRLTGCVGGSFSRRRPACGLTAGPQFRRSVPALLSPNVVLCQQASTRESP